MKKVNIAITGANGFVGSNISNYLSKYSKYKIFAYHRNFIKNKKYNINYINKDLSRSIKFNNNISILIHCASSTPPKRSESECLRDNILIDKNILRAIKKSKIKKVIFISSISVYKKYNLQTINENSLLDKKNLYALSKIKMVHISVPCKSYLAHIVYHHSL